MTKKQIQIKKSTGKSVIILLSVTSLIIGTLGCGHSTAVRTSNTIVPVLLGNRVNIGNEKKIDEFEKVGPLSAEIEERVEDVYGTNRITHTKEGTGKFDVILSESTNIQQINMIKIGCFYNNLILAVKPYCSAQINGSYYKSK